MAVSDGYIKALMKKGPDGLTDKQRANFQSNLNQGNFSADQQARLAELYDIGGQDEEETSTAPPMNGMGEDGRQLVAGGGPRDAGGMLSPAVQPEQALFEAPEVTPVDVFASINSLQDPSLNNLTYMDQFGDDPASCPLVTFFLCFS